MTELPFFASSQVEISHPTINLGEEGPSNTEDRGVKGGVGHVRLGEQDRGIRRRCTRVNPVGIGKGRNIKMVVGVGPRRHRGSSILGKCHKQLVVPGQSSPSSSCLAVVILMILVLQFQLLCQQR